MTAPPEVVAELQAGLADALVFSGHVDEATAAIEVALTLAQHHELAELFANALNRKAVILLLPGASEEPAMLLRGRRLGRTAPTGSLETRCWRSTTWPTSA